MNLGPRFLVSLSAMKWGRGSGRGGIFESHARGETVEVATKPETRPTISRLMTAKTKPIQTQSG